MRTSLRILRKKYRERALVQSATRLQNVSPNVTLDAAADLIESAWSLRDAGEAALVHRRR